MTRINLLVFLAILIKVNNFLILLFISDSVAINCNETIFRFFACIFSIPQHLIKRKFDQICSNIFYILTEFKFAEDRTFPLNYKASRKY